ncbi:hypothetical protein QQX98_005319 [Neonectria punicea]|uniref:Glutathione hydrolase n=1 Tax=Neonectria punicea TaxID=979145 RepID=A0ABR1H569_9HYPO
MRSLQSFSRALQLLFAFTVHHGLSSAAAPDIHEFTFTQGPNTRGAVASESWECSRIGKDLLAKGGNAVDAAVGTTFCVGVIAPYHSGIGGGGFMLVRDQNGSYESIDFRESAPGAAHENMYKDNVLASVHGGLSIAVPSEVRGLEYAHKKYGKLPWKVVMAGAIGRAKNGFLINPDFQRYINSAIKSSGNFLVEDPSWAEDFVKDGEILKEGSTLTRKRYAKTLTTIANEGSKAFYEGSIAKTLIETIQAHNGTMTLKDLSDYEVRTRAVLNITHRGYTLHTVGAPASGAVTLNILNTMEGFEKPQADRVQGWHNYIEAMRFAYGARGRLGDPDFHDDVPGLQAQMVDKSTGEKIRGLIDPKRTQDVRAYDPEGIYTTESHGTSHIVAADNEGMAVSLTTTVNLLFGSLVMCEKTGIVLNNEMNDFSIPGVPNEFGFEPAEANFIRPHKRPLSSITPVIVERSDGSLFATVGAAGGSRIISATTQALWRVLSEPVGIVAAVREPRLHNQLMPNTLLAEHNFPFKIIRELRRRGHNITWVPPGLSIVEGILRDPLGMFEVGSDPRQKNHGGERL